LFAKSRTFTTEWQAQGVWVCQTSLSEHCLHDSSLSMIFLAREKSPNEGARKSSKWPMWSSIGLISFLGTKFNISVSPKVSRVKQSSFICLFPKFSLF